MASITNEDKNCFITYMYIFFRNITLYGGGWSWKSGVNWENGRVTNDTFLNESILDDYQAIYRAYANQMRMEACKDLVFQHKM